MLRGLYAEKWHAQTFRGRPAGVLGSVAARAERLSRAGYRHSGCSLGGVGAGREGVRGRLASLQGASGCEGWLDACRKSRMSTIRMGRRTSRGFLVTDSLAVEVLNKQGKAT